jgi:hypothetical protein
VVGKGGMGVGGETGLHYVSIKLGLLCVMQFLKHLLLKELEHILKY